MELSNDGYWAYMSEPGGKPLLQLCLLASFANDANSDETLDVFAPEAISGEGALGNWKIERRSSCWRRAATIVECHETSLVLRYEVEGRGRLGEVSLLGGRCATPEVLGQLYTGCNLPTLFSPSPSDPRQVLGPAGGPAVIGVVGDSLPGRGHWFFTPAPFYFGLSDGGGHWLGVGLLETVERMCFTELAYVPADGGFCLELSYEGHQEVDGSWNAPGVLVQPGATSPYTGTSSYRDRLVDMGLAPPPSVRQRARWWSLPMWCGWGAQCYAAKLKRTTPQEQCTQQNYDQWLAELAAHGLVPSTIVIDDGWQAQYGLPAPDKQRWPDLHGWLGTRHAAGQRVLLWWKAWDPSGVPVELCITNAAGFPVAIDPAKEAAAAFLGANVAEMVGPTGIGADGLKVDFTAHTPSGYTLSGSDCWGTALLHRQLKIIYTAAKVARPDALVITQTPNPGFADVSDMVRLNDMLRLDEPNPESAVVAQMTYRAAVARAACPSLLVDTDDWCAPDMAQWREYLGIKGNLGVPAFYYTTHLDHTGEAFEEQDYAALRAVWAQTEKEARG